MRKFLLPGLALIYLWPVATLLAGSLRDGGLDNYLAVGRRVDFARLLANTVCISTLTVALGGLVNSLAGYALARLRFRGHGLALGLVLVCMVIPFEAVAAPLFYGISRFGLRDLLAVQILPFVANAFSIHLFYSYYLDFPQELEEAALLEGAGAWHIYARLLLPNSGPALATHSVITLLASWGAYLWPLLVTSGPQARPLSLALATFMTSPPLHWGQIFAFGVLMVAPVLAIFWLLQRYFQPQSLSSGIK